MATSPLPCAIFVGLTAKVNAGNPSTGATVTPVVTGVMKYVPTTGMATSVLMTTFGSNETSLDDESSQALSQEASAGAVSRRVISTRMRSGASGSVDGRCFAGANSAAGQSSGVGGRESQRLRGCGRMGRRNGVCRLSSGRVTRTRRARSHESSRQTERRGQTTQIECFHFISRCFATDAVGACSREARPTGR